MALSDKHGRQMKGRNFTAVLGLLVFLSLYSCAYVGQKTSMLSGSPDSRGAFAERGAGEALFPAGKTSEDNAEPVEQGGAVFSEDGSHEGREAFSEDSDASPFDWEESEDEYEEEGIRDPLEPWNRAMFVFNDKLYFWVLRPVAIGYGAVVPDWGQARVDSFFQNLSAPISFAGSLLQFKVRDALIDASRFLLNSIMGIGGLFDIASTIDLRSSDEDVGQVLGYYGFGEGFYIVWPFLGPSSLRDTVGLAGDYFLYPPTYLEDLEAVLAVYSFEKVNETSIDIGVYEDLKDSAIDPYVSLRNAYSQMRRSRIRE